MYNSKKLGHITGILYLVVIICAGFSQGVVRESVYMAGDAAATAQNILSNTALWICYIWLDIRLSPTTFTFYEKQNQTYLR